MISPAASIQISTSLPDSAKSTLPDDKTISVTEYFKFDLKLISSDNLPVSGVTPTVTQKTLTSYPNPQTTFTCGTTDAEGATSCASTGIYTPGEATFLLSLDGTDWSYSFSLQVDCPSTLASLGPQWDFSTAINPINSLEKLELLRCNQVGETYYIDALNFGGYEYHPIEITSLVTLNFLGDWSKITFLDSDHYVESPSLFGNKTLDQVTINGLSLKDVTYHSKLKSSASLIAQSATQSNLSILVDGLEVNLGNSEPQSFGLFNKLSQTTISSGTFNNAKIFAPGDSALIANECSSISFDSLSIGDSIIKTAGSAGLLCGSMVDDKNSISNVDLKDSALISTGARASLGGLVGQISHSANHARISNIKNTNFHALSLTEAAAYVGSLAGQVENLDTVAIGTVTVTDFRPRARAVGGLVGQAKSLSETSILEFVQVSLSTKSLADSLSYVSGKWGKEGLPADYLAMGHQELAESIDLLGGLFGDYNFDGGGGLQLQTLKVEIEGAFQKHAGGLFGAVGTAAGNNIDVSNFDVTTSFADSASWHSALAPSGTYANNPSYTLQEGIVHNVYPIPNDQNAMLNTPNDKMIFKNVYYSNGTEAIDCHPSKQVSVSDSIVSCPDDGFFYVKNNHAFKTQTETKVMKLSWANWVDTDGVHDLRLLANNEKPSANGVSSIAKSSTSKTSQTLPVTMQTGFTLTVNDIYGFPIVGVTPLATIKTPSSYPAPTGTLTCDPTDEKGNSYCLTSAFYVPGTITFELTVDGRAFLSLPVTVNCPSSWSELDAKFDFSSAGNPINTLNKFELLRCNQPGDTFYVSSLDFTDYVLHPIPLSEGVTIRFSGALSNLTFTNNPQYTEAPTLFGDSLNNVTMEGLSLDKLNYSYDGEASAVIAKTVKDSNLGHLYLLKSKIFLENHSKDSSASSFGLFNDFSGTRVRLGISDSIIKSDTTEPVGLLAATCSKSMTGSQSVIDGTIGGSVIFTSGDIGMLCGNFSGASDLFASFSSFNNSAVSLGAGAAVGGLIGRTHGTSGLSYLNGANISNFKALSMRMDGSGSVGGLVGYAKNVDHLQMNDSSVTGFKAIGGKIGGFIGEGASYSDKNWEASMSNRIEMELTDLSGTLNSVSTSVLDFGTTFLSESLMSSSEHTLQDSIKLAGGIAGRFTLMDPSNNNVFSRFKIFLKAENVTGGYKGGMFGKVTVPTSLHSIVVNDLDLTTSVATHYDNTRNFSPLSPPTGSAVSPKYVLLTSLIKNLESFLFYNGTNIQNAAYSTLTTTETYVSGGRDSIDCPGMYTLSGTSGIKVCPQQSGLFYVPNVDTLRGTDTTFMNFDFTSIWDQADGTNYVRLKGF